MRHNIIWIMIIAIMFPVVIILMHNRKREYDCLTPDEIEALRRYQAITDIVCPSGEWEEDYSWVQ
jgi:hypothetical protein